MHLSSLAISTAPTWRPRATGTLRAYRPIPGTPLSEGRQGTQPGVGRGVPGVPNRLMMRAWVRPPVSTRRIHGGLSPRVRGNLQVPPAWVSITGFIGVTRPRYGAPARLPAHGTIPPRRPPWLLPVSALIRRRRPRPQGGAKVEPPRDRRPARSFSVSGNRMDGRGPDSRA